MSGGGGLAEIVLNCLVPHLGINTLIAVALASSRACHDHGSHEAKTLLLLLLLLLLLALLLLLFLAQLCLLHLAPANRHMSSLLLSKGFWERSSCGTCNPYLLERKFQGWKGGIAYPHPTPEGSLCEFGNANPHAQRAFPPMSPGGTPVT